jgi:methylenetetrahydrofolate dehydrogenase (NADP+)/methenyltetrahydrofolate cyclohydrolase
MANILDGKLVAQKIKDEVKEYVDKCSRDIYLTIFQVGDNPASNTYVRNKFKACDEVGIKGDLIKFEDSHDIHDHTWLTRSIVTERADGVMLQLPIPKHWGDESFYINHIKPSQDADCLTEASLGKFYTSNDPNLAPCTAQGIIDLLDYYNIPIEGKHAVVIGRSNIVGKPVAHLLTCRDATVTLCHSKTQNLAEITKLADILVVAIGKAKFITADMVKDGAVVVDVGINRDENGKLCGDVDFDSVKEKASWITPVPGGCGVVTVAELLKNTIKLHNNAK